jgi:hypothetical protein
MHHLTAERDGLKEAPEELAMALAGATAQRSSNRKRRPDLLGR